MSQTATRDWVGVIADDLTGAADTALSFWEQGIETVIQLEPSAASLPAAEGLLVVATDTDSRHLAPGDAVRRVTRAVRALHTAGAMRIYKKIDSTLRGNVGAEVEAVLLASGASLAVVCPAFPAVGRTVVGGRVYVNGCELADSPVARDPRNPVRSSRVAHVLAEQTALPILELATPDALRAGQVPPGEEPQIVVVDAASDEALQSWIRAFEIGCRPLWVGSAGLAGALARALAPLRGWTCREPAHRAEAVLVVVGSVHPECRNQLDALLARPDCVAIAIAPSGVVAGDVAPEHAAERVLSALRAGRHAVLYTEVSDGALHHLDVVLCRAGHDLEWAGARIAAWLGATIDAVARAEPALANIVVTGGDIARAVTSVLGITTLRIVGAVAPGVPIGEAPGRRLRVVTKAGGFGERDILVRAVSMLAEGDQGDQR